MNEKENPWLILTMRPTKATPHGSEIKWGYFSLDTDAEGMISIELWGHEYVVW